MNTGPDPPQKKKFLLSLTKHSAYWFYALISKYLKGNGGRKIFRERRLCVTNILDFYERKSLILSNKEEHDLIRPYGIEKRYHLYVFHFILKCFPVMRCQIPKSAVARRFYQSSQSLSVWRWDSYDNLHKLRWWENWCCIDEKLDEALGKNFMTVEVSLMQ